MNAQIDIRAEKVIAEQKIARVLTEFHVATGAIPVEFCFDMLDVSTWKEKSDGIKHVVIGHHSLKVEI